MARAEAARVVADTQAALEARGLTRVSADSLQRFKAPSASTGKGPAIKVDSEREEDQARMNHLGTSRARSIESNSADPPWLLGGIEAPKTHTRLMEDAMHSNAVNSVIVSGKAPTQAGAMQTTRINAHGISQAAIAQSVGVELCTAYARAMMSRRRSWGIDCYVETTYDERGRPELAELPFCELGNPMGTNAANPALLWRAADDRRSRTAPTTLQSR